MKCRGRLIFSLSLPLPVLSNERNTAKGAFTMQIHCTLDKELLLRKKRVRKKNLVPRLVRAGVVSFVQLFQGIFELADAFNEYGYFLMEPFRTGEDVATIGKTS